jgi:uncharacterized protein DUF6384
MAAKNKTATKDPAPLDDVMLAMDVVDTLRLQEGMVSKELGEAGRASQLIDRLRKIYADQGIEVPDRILEEGVDALTQARFVYTPPKPGLATSLAKLYVTRSGWGRLALGAVVALVIAVGGYQFGYVPYVAAQKTQLADQLSSELPARMDALRQAIFVDTKQQSAIRQADAIRDRGKIAAAEGNLAGARKAVTELTEIRDRLRQEYTLRVVNRDGVESGVWTIPAANNAATNFYVIVEAITADNQTLALPVANEETGEIETVSYWGVRVTEAVYNSVRADKSDDGIIQQNIIGLKQYGFLNVDYVAPVLGGTITRW